MTKQKLGPNQQAWVDALRSGDYKQGKHTLHKVVDGEALFCCLGVLCHMNKDKLDITTNSDGTFFIYNNTTTALPISIVKTYGFRTYTGGNTLGDISLSTMNDNGKSFEEIADYIEQNQEKVFDKEY